MNSNTRLELEEYLEWLITPQDEQEKIRFREIVDIHCELMNKMQYMTIAELVAEINNQLSPYGLELCD